MDWFHDSIIYIICLNFTFRLWLCTYTLAVSAGAVLLLPISIISNEVLLAYPNSYYVKWLNSSLIHGRFSSGLYLFGGPVKL